MATAERPACKNCAYRSGEGTIVICNNKTHFGLAMNCEQVCDYYTREGVQHYRSVDETIGTSDDY